MVLLPFEVGGVVESLLILDLLLIFDVSFSFGFRVELSIVASCLISKGSSIPDIPLN
jgi:hypothetical protein